MKNLFLIVLGAMIFFTQYIAYRVEGRGKSHRPVVYWLTDGSKYRAAQKKLFDAWLKQQPGSPDFLLQIDPVNSGIQKIVLQSVTGVAGDIFQFYGDHVSYFVDAGILEDLTPWLKDFEIKTNDLSKSILPIITREGKVVALPANVAAQSTLCVNANAFDRVGLPFPNELWTFDEFEKLGKEYIIRANLGNPKPKRLFCAGVNLENMRYSVGVARFNETMTASALDDPRYVAVLKLYYKWIYVDHILPSKGDLDSLNAETDNTDGGSTFLHRGYFALMNIGRWHFSTTRFIDTNVIYRAVATPNGGFPVATSSARLMGLYKGSKNKELAKWFFKWLMSADYQRIIVNDADADPPALKYVQEEGYQKPSAYPNEWQFSPAMARLFRQITIAPEMSPYALPIVLNRKTGMPMAMFTSGITSAENCAKEQALGMNAVIAEHLDRHPQLRAQYQEACIRQREIDRLKAKGEKIPLSLVDNPFHRAYFIHLGCGI